MKLLKTEKRTIKFLYHKTVQSIWSNNVIKTYFTYSKQKIWKRWNRKKLCLQKENEKFGTK